MTDSVNLEVRVLVKRGRRFRISTGRTDVFSAEGVIRRAYHFEITIPLLTRMAKVR
jgi:hypothetical protein